MSTLSVRFSQILEYKRRIIFSLFAFLIISLIVFIFFTLFTNLKRKNSLQDMVVAKNSGVEIYDRENQLIYSTDARNAQLLDYGSLPIELIAATIVTEDKEFYDHFGLSLTGIARAARDNLTSLSFKSAGGSTITQQAAKNAFLSPDKSVVRKLQEVILALYLEAKFTKQEILQLYLSTAYYGDGAYGVTYASEKYFGKKVTELTLGESAFLAGLTRAPSYYSPSVDRRRSEERRNKILELMRDDRKISETEFNLAKNEELRFSEQKKEFLAPHFSLWVSSLTKEKLSSLGKIKVYTTINSDWQLVAERIVAENVVKFKTFGGNNAALVVIDNQTSDVLAFVGSASWSDESNLGKYNAALGLRQAGSAFKPIVYLAALENGKTLSQLLHDQPSEFENGYSPTNFDSKFRGNILPRFSLGNSINVPTVELANLVGLKKVKETAEKLGITTLDKPVGYYGSNLALGGGEVSLLELTNLYSTIARKGSFQNVDPIKKLTDKNGNDVIPEKKAIKQVISPENAYLISSILSDNSARIEVFGDRSLLNLDFAAAVKTGTTDDFKDSWTIGYTPEVTVGVWVGDNKGKPMSNITGVSGAAAIWNEFMSEEVAKITSNSGFAKPDKVVGIEICRLTGEKALIDSTNKYTEYFIKGTEPKNESFC